MKKVIFIFAFLTGMSTPLFATDIFFSVEISTDIARFNTADSGNSDYFTTPNYDDIELVFGIESSLFGAYTSIGADASQGITLSDTYAWVKLGDFAKITLGDFSMATTNIVTNFISEYDLDMFHEGISSSKYRRFIDKYDLDIFRYAISGSKSLGFIDEYDLGILRYGVLGSKYLGFTNKNTIKGDELSNFVLDVYIGLGTFQFGVNPYILGKRNINLGGRAHTTIGDFSHITFSTLYNDADTGLFGANKDKRTTMGVYIGFPTIGNNISVLAGYTASIIGDGLEHGIDLRLEMLFGTFAFATHNNVSLYGDNELLLYNEVKAVGLLTSDMATSVALQSQYYSNNGIHKDAVYDLGIYLELNYVVADFSMISTGVEITNIGNGKGLDIIISIPLSVTVWY